MATPFNLTARINVTGPYGLKPIIDRLRRDLHGIRTNIQIRYDSRVNTQLKDLNKTLAETQLRLKDIQASSAAAAKSLASMGGATSKVHASVASANKSMAQTNTVLAKTTKGAAEAAAEIWEFGRVSGLAIRRFAGFTIATGAIFGLIGAVKQGVKEALDFQREMVRLAQASDNTIKGMSGLEKTITDLSVGLGISSKELSGISRILVQAGLSANETRKALEAIARTELAPTFLNMTNTAEGAIAAMRQFNLGADQLMSTLGSINSVAAKFAVESEDIVSAIRRTGGVFAAAAGAQSGGKKAEQALREFISLFTSVRATTRESAESIATGLRTIFSRIQRRGTIDALKEYNVEISRLGKFVGPWEAIKRMNEELGKLDPRELRFAQIIEELGGFRQVGKVIPLILRFKDAEKALSVAIEGQDSLMRDAELAQQSWINRIIKTREAFLALMRDISKTDTFKILAESILLAANGLIKLMGALKPILPMLTALVAIKSVGVIKEFTKGFGVGVTATGGVAGLGQRIATGGGGGGAGPNSPAAANKLLGNNTTAVVQQNKQSTNLTDSLKNLIKSVDKLESTMKQLISTIGGAAVIGGGRKGGGKKTPAFGGLIRLAGGGGAGGGLPIPTAQEVAKALGLLPREARIAMRGPRQAEFIQKYWASSAGQQRKIAMTQAKETRESMPVIGNPDGSPMIGGFYLRTKRGVKPPRSITRSVVKDKDVLSSLYQAGVVGKSVDAVEMPIAHFMPSEPKRKQALGSILGGIRGSIRRVGKYLSGRDASDDLVAQAYSGKGVGLSDAAGKIFEAGMNVGSGMIVPGGKSKTLDFPGRDYVQRLFPLFDVEGSSIRYGEAKITAGGTSFKEIKQQFAKYIGENPALATELANQIRGKRGTIKKASGGMVNALLTPGELVFDPDAVRQAGVAGLHAFNLFGDPSGLGKVPSGGVYQVPGSGSTDSVNAQLASGSFVIRKSSAQGFATGGAVTSPALAGMAISREAQRNLNLIFSQMERMIRTLSSATIDSVDKFSRKLGITTKELSDYVAIINKLKQQYAGVGVPPAAIPSGVGYIQTRAAQLATYQTSARAKGVIGQMAVGGNERDLAVLRKTLTAGGTSAKNLRNWVQAAKASYGPQLSPADLRAGMIAMNKAQLRGYTLPQQRERANAALTASQMINPISATNPLLPSAATVANINARAAKRAARSPGNAAVIIDEVRRAAGYVSPEERAAAAKAAMKVQKGRPGFWSSMGTPFKNYWSQANAASQRSILGGTASFFTGLGGLGKGLWGAGKGYFGGGGGGGAAGAGNIVMAQLAQPKPGFLQRMSNKVGGMGGLGAAMLVPSLMDQLGIPNTPRGAGTKGAITGALGGAFTGAQFGPWGALIGAGVGGAMGGIDAARQARFDAAQESAAKSAEDVDKAFRALEEDLSANTIKNFNNAVADSISAMFELQDAFKSEEETLGSLGGTMAGILNFIHGGGKAEQEARSKVGAEKGVLTLWKQELAKGTFEPTGGSARSLSTRLLTGGNPLLSIGRLIPTGGGKNLIERMFGSPQEAINEQTKITKARNEAVTRQMMKQLEPSGQQSMKQFEAELAPTLDVIRGGFGGQINVEQLAQTNVEDFTRIFEQAAAAIVTLDKERYNVAIKEASELSTKEERLAVMRKHALPIMQEQAKMLIKVAMAEDATRRAMRGFEGTADAMGKIGDAAVTLSKDLESMAGIFSNFQSVLASGTVNLGQIINPFEDIASRSPAELQRGLTAIQNAFGAQMGRTASRIPIDVGQSKIVADNLANVLESAMQEYAGTKGDISQEEFVVERIRNDPRLAGLKDVLKEDFIKNIRSTFTNRQRGQTLEEQLQREKDLASKFAEMLKASEETAKKVYDTLIQRDKYIAQAANQLAQTIIDANNKYDDAFRMASDRQRELAEMVGRPMGPAETLVRQNANVERLTARAGIGGPGGTTDVTQIRNAIVNLNNQLIDDNAQREQIAAVDSNQFNILTDRIRLNTMRLSDANKALDNLATATETLSAIQTKLAEIEQRREAGRGLLEKLSAASFDPKAMTDIRNAMIDFQKLVTGRGAGVAGGAQLALEIANVMGPQFANSVQTAIDRSRLASLGGLGGLLGGNAPGIANIRNFIQGAGVGTIRGQSPQEQALIDQYQQVSDRQVMAINAQGQVIESVGKRIVNSIIWLAAQFDASIRNIGAKNAGGFIGGPYKGNRDTEVTQLTPGEFVVRRNVAQKYATQLSLLNSGVPVEQAFAGFQAGGAIPRAFGIPGFGGQVMPMTPQGRVFRRAAMKDLMRRYRLARRTGSMRYISGAGFLSSLYRSRGMEVNVQGALKEAYKQERAARAMNWAEDKSVNLPQPGGKTMPVPIVDLLRRFNAEFRNYMNIGRSITGIHNEMLTEIQQKRLKINLNTPQGIRAYRNTFVARMRDRNLPGTPPPMPTTGFLGHALKGIPKNNPLFIEINRLFRSAIMPRFNATGIGGTPRFINTDPNFQKFEAAYMGSPLAKYAGGGSVTAGVVPGEFVVKRNIAEKNKDFLTKLNATGQVPHFAAGGAVGFGGGRSMISTDAISAIRQFSASVSSFAQFATQLQQASQNLRNINIPSKITMEVAPMQVNVVINGAEALSSMEDSMRVLVANEINSALSKHINIITGETKENFVQQSPVFIRR